MVICILFVLLGLDQGTVHDLLFVPRTYKDKTFSCSRHKTYPCLHQRSLHISGIAKAFHFTRRRGVCCLHLHYQRVMGSSHVLVCLVYLHERAVHLCPPVTRFTPSQREVMGSDRVHSSPFSGSGNPVSTFWVSAQHPIALVKEQASNLHNYNVKGPWRNR